MILMKGNNGTGNNVTRDDWRTPPVLFELLNKQYKFNFDCCANESNTLCPSYSENFIKVSQNTIDPDSIAWMNPPFSKAEEMFKHFFSLVHNGVAIYRCDNPESKLYQDIIFPGADWVQYIRGRVAYEGFDGKSPRFPSALIGVRVKPPVYVDGVVVLFSTKK